jgi:serine/threonine protein kinase
MKLGERLMKALNQELRDRVRDVYSAAALRPDGEHAFPVGRRFAEGLGYPSDLLDTLPPACVEGSDVDSRSDVFCLGVVLYEMVTGRHPFRGKTPAAVLGSILTESPAKPSDVKPGIPAKLDYLILKAMEKNPAKRYLSAAELAPISISSPKSEDLIAFGGSLPPSQ